MAQTELVFRLKNTHRGDFMVTILVYVIFDDSMTPQHEETEPKTS